MKTYTVSINFDITGKDIPDVEIKGVLANTPRKLDRLKNALWGAMLAIANLHEMDDISNEGTMFIATAEHSDDNFIGKLYDDETGEEIDLD